MNIKVFFKRTLIREKEPVFQNKISIRTCIKLIRTILLVLGPIKCHLLFLLKGSDFQRIKEELSKKRKFLVPGSMRFKLLLGMIECLRPWQGDLKMIQL